MCLKSGKILLLRFRHMSKLPVLSGIVWIKKIKHTFLYNFFISILLNLLLVIYSFKEKPKITLYLGIVNLITLIIPLIILFYFGGIFEDIEQLKIGYYLLVFNLIIIVCESSSEMKRKNIS